MTARIYMDGNIPRIITSKAGYDASPTLANEHKTFDSNWYSGGGIRWTLEQLRSGASWNDSSIQFPETLNYVPKVWAMCFKQWYGDQLLFSSSFPNRPSWFNPPWGGYVISNENLKPEAIVSNSGVVLKGVIGSNYGRINDVYCVALIYGD